MKYNMQRRVGEKGNGPEPSKEALEEVMLNSSDPWRMLS